ncbi:rho GTPase-activating protein 12a isoform X6 [Esox lucius]|uniref:Rho GTPase activating protein 12a n=1 Tax=Esox lucius TaxID=8010 RepID=A0A6Q2XMH1_ESOLU|nr:rho GTPase-activating protein 12a isoform X6 [Esox lucius]
MASERDVRGRELPIAPGQVYIEVEYDYQYKSKERQICIQQGERYMLVKKTNGDWWQVKKDEATKAFYVPAQYVREVRKALMPPPKPLPLGHHAGVTGGNSVQVKPSASSESLTVTSFVRPTPSSPTPSALPVGTFTPPSQRRDKDPHPNPGRDAGSLKDLDKAAVEIIHPHGCDTLPRARASSPELRRDPLDIDMAAVHCDSEGSERRYDSSGDELSSSSTEHLQAVFPSGNGGRSESPVYTNLQELKISGSNLPPAPSTSPLHVHGDWETHKDQSGRHYYHNRSTQERTWKPPRAREASTGSRGDPHGNSTGEAEWIKHVDEQGRPYYYNADGSRSEWVLPKYNQSPPLPGGGDTHKSRSLDRKQVEPIVLSKWRHSTYVLDTNDKDAATGPKVSGSPDSDSSDPSSPKHPTSPSEKCGILNVTKITEHGKKVRKSWMSSWAVLHSSTLLFAKGQGGGTSWFGVGQSKPEFTVDLRGGSIEWASKEKSSKKHVIELKTRQGTELLIQSDAESIISDWYRALLDTISTHAWESDEAIEEDMPESPGAEKQDREKDHKMTKAIKPSTSMDTSENKKTKHKLKKFLTRRPTLQTVRDKGYIKDQVFGCSLGVLCQRENSSVPSFVMMCIDHVENNALNVDGLYRVSGNLAVIQKLRFAVNHDEKVDLEDGKWEDIHVITGALKMFFRELPEPLFTYGLFQDFVNAIKIPDYKLRVQSIKELVKQLPRPNQDTMQVLFKHLRKVIDYGEVNRMTTQSVAIVFGPTLLRPETETWNMAVHMVYQNQIVELILLEYEGIFR